MKLAEIRAKATSVHNCHESILRSHSVVEKVRELLRKQTPPEVILEIIDDLMGAPQHEYQFGSEKQQAEAASLWVRNGTG